MRNTLIAATLLLSMSSAVHSQTYIETLTRGAVALPQEKGNFISWRLLSTDAKDVTFDVLRDGTAIATGLTSVTNLTDPQGTGSSIYSIVSHQNGKTVTTGNVHTWSQPYLSVPVTRPADGTTPDGQVYSYIPNDASVGDIDGDGEYELFLKWDPSNSHDNAHNGYTGHVYIDCYKISYSNPSANTGRYLWRIDMGQNIRAGAHYTQFMVYDFNGDGKAEMICKTAPGTIDGKGKYVTAASKDKEIRKADNSKVWYNENGRVLTGPEYLTVFSGRDGHAIHTIYYNPNRAFGVGGSAEYDTRGWGDKEKLPGNRGERYLAGVAFLDGRTHNPSAVMCRGYYTNAYLWAVDFDGKKLSTHWFHRSEKPHESAYGQGAHSLSIGDVDGDGCDEILYGSAAIDHDGKLLYTTNLGHGDAQHLGDFDPDRPGLEYYMVHEEKPYGCDLRDARTGEILYRETSNKDTGRGLIADVDSTHRGFEFGSSISSTIRDIHGDSIGATSKRKYLPMNFRIYWDGDLYDEILGDSRRKSKEDFVTGHASFIGKWTGNSVAHIKLNGKDISEWGNSASCNGTKATPCLQADLFGDWREELIEYDESDKAHLNIFTTNIPTPYRVTTLMHDHIYRMGIAWQNTAYNQPPHISYYLPDLFRGK